MRLAPWMVAAVLTTAGASIFAAYYIKTLGPRLKIRVVRALEDRFDADVELKSMDVNLFPKPRVEGRELAIKHKQWNDQRPLLFIRHFTASTDFLTLLDKSNRVEMVSLDGMEIHIPPRGGRGALKPAHDDTALRFMILSVVAKNTLLEIEPRQPGKLPLRFDITELIMHSVGPGKAMAFSAKLTNPQPPGLIDSEGHFGPWQRDNPRATPVAGDYTFRHADLGVFKGISGTLSSEGKYDGVLDRITVDGGTDTPNFSLKGGGDPIHLKTSFHALVDGTDGDTVLDPVDATFLNSEFICRGGIVHQAGMPGKTVSLDAITQRARIEDILELIVGGDKPVVKGAVNFRSRIEIPPGQLEVRNKLKLNAQFSLQAAEFTNPKFQNGLRTLSDRGRGISKKEEENGEGIEAVASNMRVGFTLDRGQVSFSHISFSVPGAQIDLKGGYELLSQKLDLTGTFKMQATLSQTQSGIKQWVLKPFDPLFKKDGAGFEVPLSVSGTKDRPIVAAKVFRHAVNIH